MEYTIYYLNTQGEEMELTLEIEYETSYDGIGPYEFWGFKGFDKGHLCVDINEIIYDKDGLSQEEITLIEKQIEKEIEDIQAACLKDLEDIKSSREESDYDIWKETGE